MEISQKIHQETPEDRLRKETFFLVYPPGLEELGKEELLEKWCLPTQFAASKT